MWARYTLRARLSLGPLRALSARLTLEPLGALRSRHPLEPLVALEASRARRPNKDVGDPVCVDVSGLIERVAHVAHRGELDPVVPAVLIGVIVERDRRASRALEPPWALRSSEPLRAPRARDARRALKEVSDPILIEVFRGALAVVPVGAR